MKRATFILIFLISFIPRGVFASVEQIPHAIKALNLVYSNTLPIIKNLKDIKRGTYLPGVYDSKIVSFQVLSTNANAQIKKKLEEERRKRLEQQMRLGGAEAAFDGKYVDIDLSSQTLTAFQDRAPVYKFKISSGKWTMPTPTGSFSIISKTSRAYSSKYNLYMPWWMAFTGQGHGIHELPEWSSGAKEGAGHLGIPVSHGCVRLGVGSAKTLYDWTNLGDKVYVHR